MKLKHILLTTDLSPESLHPCKAVAEFAKLVGAQVTLLYVVQELRMVAHGAPMAPPITPLDVSADVKHAEKALDDQKLVLGDDVDVKTAVVTGDKIHEAIVDYAHKHDVDLIALSTHGRTGFRHFALGSIAESVLRHSDVPVLCFPQPKS